MTVFDHLWQSTLFGGLVFLLTLMLRKNSATIRYRLWLAASLKFLTPFSLLAALGEKTFVHTVPAESMLVLARLRPVVVPFSSAAPAPDHLPWLTILTAIWALGAVAIAVVWLVRWHRLSAIARAGRTLPFDLPVPVRATPLMLEPGLVGIRRPVILLPEGICDQLSRSEMDAILRHELCHHARRDNLLAALHMLVEAVFWFHPLVWLIGARLIEECEAACDESVLAGGQNPLEYAQAILRVCRLYLRSPLPCASGVAGADLGRRVDAIMAGRDVEDLDSARKFLLAGLLLATLLAPFVGGGLKSAPSALLMQRLATALMPAPAPEVTQPAAVAMLTVMPRPRQHPAPRDILAEVEARTLQERALPAAASVIVIAMPSLSDVQADTGEINVCRAPQPLQNSRLLGPEVCMTQSEWDSLAKRNLVLMPDGRTLAANYETERSKAPGTCNPTGNGASATQLRYVGDCF